MVFTHKKYLLKNKNFFINTNNETVDLNQQQFAKLSPLRKRL